MPKSLTWLMTSYSVVCSFITNKQQNKQPQLFLKMLDGFQTKKCKEEIFKLCTLRAAQGFLGINQQWKCWLFSRNQPNKNAQMYWLDWRYKMAVVYKLRHRFWILEKFWNYGSQWMQNWELWKFIKSQLHSTSSGICKCAASLRLKFKTNSVVSSLNTKAQNVTSKCAPNKDPRVTVFQFFTELRGKCQFFLRFGRQNFHESPILRGNVFSRHSLLESR